VLSSTTLGGLAVLIARIEAKPSTLFHFFESFQINTHIFYAMREIFPSHLFYFMLRYEEVKRSATPSITNLNIFFVGGITRRISKNIDILYTLIWNKYDYNSLLCCYNIMHQYNAIDQLVQYLHSG